MRINRLLLIGLFLSGLIVYMSCRKMDGVPNKSSKEDITTRFFTDHAPSEPNLQALADLLKRENEKAPFVNKIVQRIGYPRWNKTLSYSSADGPGSTSRTGTNDSLDLYFIPFVRDTQQYVNACLVIKTLRGDTTYKWLCDWQYKDSAYTGLNRRNTATLLMVIDREIFGQQREYLVTDTTLFDSRTSSVHITGTSITGTSAQNRSATVEICVTYLVPVNGWLSGCEPGSSCNPYQEVTQCTSTTLDDNLGGGNNINNGTGWTGGGSTAGWTQPPANPCALFSTGGREPELPPGCTEAYGPGWMPIGVEAPTPSEPIDSILKKISVLANKYSDSVFNISNNQHAEYSFTIVDRHDDVMDTLNLHTNGSGLAVVPNYNVWGGRRLRGIWHSHPTEVNFPLSDTNSRSGPSGDDVGQLFDLKDIQPPIPVLTDCGNVRYALVVENPQKANAWFRLSGNGPLVLYNRHLLMVYNDPRSSTSQFHQVTVELLLQILGSSTACGIGLYKSNNPEKTAYTKLN